MNNSIVAFLNSIRRTDLSTSRLIAMPANVSGRSYALATFDEIEIDHRFTAMCLALLTSLQTGAASDATRGVDVELVSEHYAPPCEMPL